jgi:hypothetical protein
MKISRNMKGEGGFSLPLSLFAVLILVTSARALTMYGWTAVANHHIIRQGEAEHENSKVAVSQARNERGGCTRILISQRHAIVCHDPEVAWSTFPSSSLPSGTVDYDSLFGAASPCGQRVVAPEPLAPLLPVSTSTCLIEGAFAGSVVRRENIDGRDIAIKASGAAASILASPGRVRISERLTTDSDLIVVAGGDLRIERLENTGPGEIRVSLFSSLGSIYVANLGSRIAVLAAGRQKMQVPPSLPSLEYPLPLFRPRSLRGFEMQH